MTYRHKCSTFLAVFTRQLAVAARKLLQSKYLKGKSAIRIHRDLSKVKGTLFGRSFWARWYCVSTVGIDELAIRQYIQDQEQHQQNLEQDEQDELNP